MAMMLAGWLGAVIALNAQAVDTFRLVSRSIPERGQVKAVEFAFGDKKASLILPNGWRLGGKNNGVMLQSADFGATVSIQSVEVVDNPSSQVRQQVLSQAERVEVISEYEWITSIGKAAVVDAVMAGDRDLRLQCRAYAIAFNGRTLLISLTAAPQSFEAVQASLVSLLASLRVE